MKHFYYNPYSLYKSMEFTDSLQTAIDGLIDDELSINEDAIIYHFNDSNDVVEKIIISRESLKILYSVTISEEFQLEEYSRCKLFKSSIYINRKEKIASRNLYKLIKNTKTFPCYITIVNISASNIAPENYKDLSENELAIYAKYREIYISEEKLVEREIIELDIDDVRSITIDYDYGIKYDGIYIEPRTKIKYDNKECFIGYSYGDADIGMTLEEVKNYKGERNMSLTPIIYDNDGCDYEYIPSRKLINII